MEEAIRRSLELQETETEEVDAAEQASLSKYCVEDGQSSIHPPTLPANPTGAY